MTIWPTRSRSVSDSSVRSTHRRCADVSGAVADTGVTIAGAGAATREGAQAMRPKPARQTAVRRMNEWVMHEPTYEWNALLQASAATLQCAFMKWTAAASARLCLSAVLILAWACQPGGSR